MNYIPDILYGQIPYTRDDLRLFQTPELSRLRHISMATTPTWSTCGLASHRFEHSVGTAYLARIVGRKECFAPIAKELFFAALVHDVAQPPFCHMSDPYMEKIYGKRHEDLLTDLITDSELGREISRQGGDVHKVMRLIEGKYKPHSDLINGSIDLDNLDNTLRYAISTGIMRRQNYQPIKLAKGFGTKDGHIELAVPSLQVLSDWESCRRKVYQFIFNFEDSIPVFRALYFAYREGELTKNFFRLNDYEALEYLKGCNERTKILMQRAESWQFYDKVYEKILLKLSLNQAKYFEDYVVYRGKFADIIAKEIGCKPEDINVSLSRNKGFKQIHLPIISEKGEHFHNPKQQMSWIVQVFAYGQAIAYKNEIKPIMDQLIEE